MDCKLAVLDTNFYLNYPDQLHKFDKIFINTTIIEEIDNLKSSDSENKAYKARVASRAIERATNIEFKNTSLSSNGFTNLDMSRNDNKIIQFAKSMLVLHNECVLITDDLNMVFKCKCVGIPVVKWNSEKCEESYTGYKIIDVTEDELAIWYSSEIKTNIWNLQLNEYGLIRFNGEIVEKVKRSKNGIDVIKYKQIQSPFCGKIKPRNIKQELAFDMLQDTNTHLKCITGCFGSGKDYLMINTAINLIEENKYEKIIWIVQNQQVKNTRDIGSLPGGINEKLSPYTSILADKLGGQYGLDMYINHRQVEIVPLAFIRGRNFDKSILMMSEAENITKEHMQLIMSRIGEKSMLMVNGDFKQTDGDMFKRDSGLKIFIDKLKGDEEFGYIMFDKTERSKLAEMASLLG